MRKISDLSANSAIAGDILATDTPWLRQCDVGWSGKRSTGQTAVYDCHRRIGLCSEWKFDHAKPLFHDSSWLSLAAVVAADRVEARWARLSLRSWHACLHHGMQTSILNGDFVLYRRRSWTFQRPEMEPGQDLWPDPTRSLSVAKKIPDNRLMAVSLTCQETRTV